MLFDHNLSAVIQQAGYETPESLLFLSRLVSSVCPSWILELGTGYGCSTAFLALSVANGMVVSIDDCRDEAKSIEVPRRNLERCGLHDRVILINGSTFDLAALVKESVGDVLFDFVFMDASHLAKLMKKEYGQLELLLQENHVIVIDDLFDNDVFNFVSWLFSTREKYTVCHMVRYHHGMAVLGTNSDFLRGL